VFAQALDSTKGIKELFGSNQSTEDSAPYWGTAYSGRRLRPSLGQRQKPKGPVEKLSTLT
jgi:hypothetical protein